MTDHTGICIVLPATYYGSNELSHCTLAFLGNTDEVDYPRERVDRIVNQLRAQPFWHTWDYFRTHVIRMDLFGVERDTPVRILHPGEKLMSIRELTVDLLEAYDIPYAQNFEYTPHITVKNHDFQLTPGMTVKLHRPTLWWGNDRPQVMNPQFVGGQ